MSPIFTFMSVLVLKKGTGPQDVIERCGPSLIDLEEQITGQYGIFISLN